MSLIMTFFYFEGVPNVIKGSNGSDASLDDPEDYIAAAEISEGRYLVFKAMQDKILSE